MIEIRNLSKSFPGADGETQALKNISLTIGDGEIYGIIGMSGAGKSTLVRTINMLERPTSGTVLIDGTDIGALSPSQLRRERRDIAMIFQGFNLLSQRNCLKNVCFPLELAGVGRAQARKKAEELLALVGLSDKLKSYPSQLSGGQQQRVAIARALATDPKILLCDEATSALDPQTTRSILSLIADINKRLGITVIVITHQMSVVEQICTRVAILDRGEVAEEGKVTDIFSSPATAAAKALVFPEEEGFFPLASEKNGGIIRIVFNGSDSVETPIIAKLAVDTGIQVSILSASTRAIGEKAYGNMLLSVPGGADETGRALEYLKRLPDIFVEEVSSRE